MKTTINKLIHFIIKPCEKIPILIEKQNTGNLSFINEKWLSFHLYVCISCASYKRKFEKIDSLLSKKMVEENKKIKINKSDIQEFKGLIKNKINI